MSIRCFAAELPPQAGFPAPDTGQKKFNSRFVAPMNGSDELCIKCPERGRCRIQTLFLANGNTAFWDLHHQIFLNQAALASKLPAMAFAVGVDAGVVVRFDTFADRLIDDSIALASELGVSGTPAFFIDGVMLSGAQPVDSFSKIIDEHIIEAKQLLAAGTPVRSLYPTLLAKHPPKVAGEDGAW